MATITIVGVGPGPTAYLTREAEEALIHAERLFFRTAAHPVYEWLSGIGKHLQSFDVLYTMPWDNPEDIYEFMVAILFKEAELKGDVVYAVPGSADVLEETTNLIRNRGIAEGVRVRVVSGVSFLDLALAEINFDFSLGLQVVLPLTHLGSGRFTSRLGLIVCQIEAGRSGLDSPRVDITMQYLLKVYNADHPVTLIWTDGLPEYATRSRTFALRDLVREYGEAKFFSSLYVPPVK
jgi:tetrapyrrole methylase family protein / MazG family protein